MNRLPSIALLMQEGHHPTNFLTAAENRLVFPNHRNGAAVGPLMVVARLSVWASEHRYGANERLVMRYSVPAVRATQNGQEMFLFFIPAIALKALPIKVEQFDAEKPYDHVDQGYQR